MTRPGLRGRRVLVTRAASQAQGLAVLLRAAGATVVELPLISIEPPSDPGPAIEALRLIGAYDHVVFTSANAVDGLATLGLTAGIAIASALREPRPAVVAIGAATAAALAANGVRVDRQPLHASSEGLSEAFADDQVARLRFLLPRAEEGRDEFPRWLRKRGATVDVLATHRTVPVPGVAAPLREVLAGGLDAVTFTSPSAVLAFMGAGGHASAGMVTACIGVTTAETARSVGLEPRVVATVPDAAGLVAAISDHFA